MRQSYPFPIVSKGGVLYYDLAGINDTSLDILSNSQKVRGITASHGNCKIHSLYLGTHYHLDEELVTNCANLSLRLEGTVTQNFVTSVWYLCSHSVTERKEDTT